MKTTIIVTISVILIIGGLGCAALSEIVTPARIEPRAVDYAVKANVAEPNAFKGYQNLEKVLRLEAAVGNAHQTNQLALQQLMDLDRLDYAQLNNIVSNDRTVAQTREGLIFGEDGLLTLGLSMAGFGTLTGFVGLMRKRPQDMTPEDVEDALSDVKVELSDKERRLIEVVKGVQAFLDSKDPNKDIAVLEQLKTLLSSYQSSDTKQEVARIKATL